MKTSYFTMDTGRLTTVLLHRFRYHHFDMENRNVTIIVTAIINSFQKELKLRCFVQGNLYDISVYQRISR